MDHALSPRSSRRSTQRCSPTAAKASCSMRSATGRQGDDRSSRCKCSSPATGQCNKGTTCSSASKPTSAQHCLTARSSPTSSQSKIQPPSTTRRSTDSRNRGEDELRPSFVDDQSRFAVSEESGSVAVARQTRPLGPHARRSDRVGARQVGHGPPDLERAEGAVVFAAPFQATRRSCTSATRQATPARL